MIKKVIVTVTGPKESGIRECLDALRERVKEIIAKMADENKNYISILPENAFAEYGQGYKGFLSIRIEHEEESTIFEIFSMELKYELIGAFERAKPSPFWVSKATTDKYKINITDPTVTTPVEDISGKSEEYKPTSKTTFGKLQGPGRYGVPEPS